MLSRPFSRKSELARQEGGAALSGLRSRWLQRQKLGGVSGSQQCSDNICWNWPNRPATCFKKTVPLNIAEFEQFWVDGLEF
jgi:hypothetical protein